MKQALPDDHWTKNINRTQIEYMESQLYDGWLNYEKATPDEMEILTILNQSVWCIDTIYFNPQTNEIGLSMIHDEGKLYLLFSAEVEWTNDEMIVLSHFKNTDPRHIFNSDNMVWYDLANAPVNH